MPNDGIKDAALWQADYRRQLLSIKAALHSLKLQTDEHRAKQPTSRGGEADEAHSSRWSTLRFKR